MIKKSIKNFFLLLIICLIFAFLIFYITYLIENFHKYSTDYYEPKDTERYEWLKKKGIRSMITISYQ